jgi:hypothetical protein
MFPVEASFTETRIAENERNVQLLFSFSGLDDRWRVKLDIPFPGRHLI